MSDIIERLRAEEIHLKQMDIRREAADEIDRLKEEIRVLEVILDEAGVDVDFTESGVRWTHSKREWISVEDRLPDTDVLVLAVKGKAVFAAIYCGKGEHEGQSYDELDVGSWSEDENHWYWPEGWYEQQINWDDFKFLQVLDSNKPTHWQPLPPPPEES